MATPLIPGLGSFFRKEIFPQRSGLAEVQRLIDREISTPVRDFDDVLSRGTGGRLAIKPTYGKGNVVQDYDPGEGYRAVFGNAPSSIRSSLTPLSDMAAQGSKREELYQSDIPGVKRILGGESSSFGEPPAVVNVPVESVSRISRPKEDFREGFMRVGDLTKQALQADFIQSRNRNELATMMQIRASRNVDKPVTLSDGSQGFVGGYGRGGVAALPKSMASQNKFESFFQNDFPALLPENYIPSKKWLGKTGTPYISWKKDFNPDPGFMGKPSNVLGIGMKVEPSLQAAYKGTGFRDADQARYDVALYQRPSVQVERGLTSYKEPIFPVLGWSDVGRPADARANYLQGTRSGWRSGLKSGQLGPEMEEKLINVQRNELLRQKPLSQIKPEAPGFYPIRNEELGRNFMNPVVESLDDYMGQYFDELMAPGVRDTRSVPSFALENRGLLGSQIASLPEAKVVETINPAYGARLRGEIPGNDPLYRARTTSFADPLSTVQGDRPELLNTGKMVVWDKYRQELDQSPTFAQSMAINPSFEQSYGESAIPSRKVYRNEDGSPVQFTRSEPYGKLEFIGQPQVLKGTHFSASPIIGNVPERLLPEAPRIPEGTVFEREVPVTPTGRDDFYNFVTADNARVYGEPSIVEVRDGTRPFGREAGLSKKPTSRYGYEQVEVRGPSPMEEDLIRAVGQEPLYREPRVIIDNVDQVPVMRESSGQLVIPGVGNDPRTEVFLDAVAKEQAKSRMRQMEARDKYLEPVEPDFGITTADLYEQGIREREAAKNAELKERARRLLEARGLTHLMS